MNSMKGKKDRKLKDELPRSVGIQYASGEEWRNNFRRSVFIPVPKKGNAKECSNYRTIAFILHTSKECLKFSKPGSTARKL